MALIEWHANNPAKSGAEKYTPPNHRAPKHLSDIEDEIRDFIRRDVRQPKSAADGANGSAAEKLNDLIRRVSGASMEEIDRVISELQSVRDMLRSEGERVSREIAGYARLSYGSVTVMKIISNSLTQWKSGPDKSGQPPCPAA